jgi:transposase
MQTENQIRERLDRLLEETRQLDPKTDIKQIQTNSKIMRELEDTIYLDQYKSRIRVSPTKAVPQANNNATSEIVTKKEEVIPEITTQKQ